MENLNLYQKLAEIRQKISVRKTGFNKFGNYNYYEIDAIYGEAKKLFNDYGIFTTFNLIYDETAQVYRATLMVIDADKPDISFSMCIDSPLNQLKGSASQQVGSNNTYQSKYLYMDLLMLDDGATDPDKTETHGRDKPSQPAKKRPQYQQVTRVPVKEDVFEDEFL